MRGDLLILSFIGYLVIGTSHGLSQDISQSVRLSIDLGDGESGTIPDFVFVKGKLVGVAPGAITLASNETVPVEIGIAQLKNSPLYSFQFGPKEIKYGRVGVVTTNYQFAKDRSLMYLEPNSKEEVSLTRLAERAYLIKLSSGSDTGAGGFLNKRGYEESFVAKGGKVEVSDKYTSGALHLAYNAEKGGIINLKDPSDWSGASLVDYQGGMFTPYQQQTEKWTIISNPVGAKIFTPDGEQGRTTNTISIAKSLSAFVVLQLEGYQQCTQADCDKRETPGSITFTCNLKKLR
jgi:hypothetical protein